MRKGWLAFAAVGLVGLGFTAGQVMSQDMGGGEKKGEGGGPAGGMTPEQMKEMEAMMKAGTPGEQHKKMAAMKGEWTVAGQNMMGPGMPGTEFTGTAKFAMLLGDRFQTQEFSSAFMGMPFDGFGVSGYDNTTKEYVGVWMDSFGTTIMVMRGKADATGKVTMTGDFTDPMGEKQVMRMIEHPEKDGAFHFEMFNKCSKFPEEYKCMDMVYNRKK